MEPKGIIANEEQVPNAAAIRAPWPGERAFGPVERRRKRGRGLGAKLAQTIIRHAQTVGSARRGWAALGRFFGLARFQFARFQWLRACYFEHHLCVELPVCTFETPSGAPAGALTKLHLHRGRVQIAGWTFASAITISHGDARVVRQPRADTSGLTDRHDGPANARFSASFPPDDAPFVFELTRDGKAPLRIDHKPPVAKATARARRRLELRFWADLLPRLPMIALGLLRRDGDLPRRVKLAFRLTGGEAASALAPGFLASAPVEPPVPIVDPPQIRVIMPVFNAFEHLREALARVVAHTDDPWRLILVEDHSTDPRVRPWLRAWSKTQAARSPGRVTLLENDRNLGFVQSVNRALAHIDDGDGPVVLLNSDAMVPPGWARRLTAPLDDPAVASVTPMSNDAEIFSVPIVAKRTDLAAGQGDAIDAALLARISDQAPRVVVPTGVGFCMALSARWLRRVGGFDPAFGRGYGEEVDWCRRALAIGGQHVAVPGLFVEHRGGASFGAEKEPLLRRNSALLSRRHPGFDRAVQDFIRDDPLATARIVAALAWAESLPWLEEIPVFIAHSMGGGAERYLAQRLERLPVSVVLRFGGAHRCGVELTTPAGRMVGYSDDLGVIEHLLAPVSKRRIIYSSAMGDYDLSILPGFLARLASAAPLDILFHDYLPISPSINLLDQDGIYRGVPAPDRADRAHAYRRPDGALVRLADWQRGWGSVLDVADRVVVFSRASAELVGAAYPQVRARLDVVGHAPLDEVPRLAVAQSARMVVGVLGAIGPQKGAAVVSALSDLLEAEPGIGLAVIGRLAPGFPLAPEVPVHGTYEIADLPALVARYRITHWLIPSVWPETFSYTVHECLATGLPTLAFGLGGQGDAVRNAENGVVLGWDGTRNDPRSLAARVFEVLRDLADQGVGARPPLSSVISAAARATVSPRSRARPGPNRADGPETEIPATGWPALSKIAAPTQDIPL